MKTYQGRREGYAVIVTANGAPLNPRLDLWNHSPSGFEWGYGGSGPAQLALAILADHLRDDVKAVRLHGDFKRTVVADLPYDEWQLTTADINTVLKQMQAEGHAV